MTDVQEAPLLEVKDLRVKISTKAGTFYPVNGHNFTLNKGETLGIVGESGSGKSMTATSLVRLLPKHAAEVESGSIELEGRDLLKLSEAEMRKVRGSEIAMILQDPQTSLNPSFTVGNQISEALSLHAPGPKKTMRERAINALRKVKVAAPEHRVDCYPGELSGGMRQRVVGAIAISCEPKIIIADEPTTSLDVTVQAQYLRLLKELQDDTGMGIIFITHDFGIVANLCHKIVVMYYGRIVESGTVERIFAKPAHPYTEALIGAVPKLRGHEGRLRTIKGQPPAPMETLTGCPFAPRCDKADSRCFNELPPTFDADGDGEHLASCWRVIDQ
ncbi:peptide/nickel transport system ATP-binding protein/oligopeptide transport system ATP-binding protein [Pacificibacter maritimus]|uniref:Peptide/nickel transport system ATP-binding protein/oligopeptide transport system ATP-binding protein n=1 Tax=Pacificibacter maritimus TaxID=762213 RepID=A0A3N4U9U9_9RHOB|nr:ABC transporter ATP-binding protein [Pacificibacter maritimus]RPE66548.1 peptide/nickel transport system ATP-binding protein/oligopeptide transport system ATP-binding protein [Pacificibacter maritimus]